MQTVEHPDKRPTPFGLDPEAITACYERSDHRPPDMSRYEAFAFQVEAELARQRGTHNAGILPVLRAYGRLKMQAEYMAQAIASADLRECVAALNAYRLDMSPEYEEDEDDED